MGRQRRGRTGCTAQHGSCVFIDPGTALQASHTSPTLQSPTMQNELPGLHILMPLCASQRVSIGTTLQFMILSTIRAEVWPKSVLLHDVSRSQSASSYFLRSVA
eukprot:TRINITY_DN25505_c0_g1_i1.p2 TRINITY_DN25505_c0_g1~~TRINITY_DN25505_c0_g1_i1.p2  ORF type:complete len:104 (+),score=7.39 TRINITY_DN25505_c0_g1_i1:376-687(+)